MKRKLLSILLTFCLAFSLLPTAALADGEDTPAPTGESETPAVEYVAKVGEQGYATLAEAVAAAKNGQTVKMLNNTNVTQEIYFSDKTITLDLNGKIITGQFEDYYSVIEAQGTAATLIVEDTSAGKTGTIHSNHYGLTARDDGNITVNSGTIIGDDAAALSGNNTTGNMNFTVNGGTLTAGKGPAIYQSGQCKLTITGGTLNGGISLRMGQVNISGGTINAATENLDSPAEYYNYSGNAWLPDALYVFGGTYDKGDETYGNSLNLNITGGTFNCTNGQGSAVAIYDLGKVTQNANVKISGGKFATTTNGRNAYDVLSLKDIGVTNPITGFGDHSGAVSSAISGGTFSSDVSAYVAEGYVQNENGTVEQLGETNAVAKIDDTYYKTLADAIAAVSDDATITLLKDVTGTSTLSVNKTVTIDLNGHKITGGDTRAIHVTGGTLTLTGTGVVTSKKTSAFDPNSSVIRVGDNNGDSNRAAGLILDENVTVDAPESYGVSVFGNKTTETVTVKGKIFAGVAAAISGNGSTGYGNTTITIEPSAEVVSTGYTGIYHPQAGKLIIKGGTIKGLSAIESKSGETTIEVDGNPTITATGEVSHGENNNGKSTSGYAIAVVNNKHYTGNASVTIKSGKYTGVIAVVNDQVDSGKNGTISITGGLFSSDPSAYVAAGHYVDASNNGDYPYTVKEGTKTDAPIIVKDATDVTVPTDAGLTDADKNAIKAKSNVDGVAEAIADNKAALIPADVDITGAKKVEIEVSVKVEVKSADLSGENAAKTLTFEAKPVATITVTKSDNTTVTKNNVPVPNSLLSGEITVKLPLPAGFTPEQIKHISSDGSVEYFLKTAKRGAKTFEIKDDCAVFKITKFSKFELSGTVTYVEPSYYSGSSSDPTYSVSTPSKTENGSVTVSPKSASKGDTVTVTVKPDSGYVLETLTVTDKNGNELTLKDKGNGKYTFTMPAGKVEVKATFMEDNSMLNFFYDVPNNAYFYEAVKWAVKNGITTGVGNDLFAPEQPCTRAQIVTFLWRAAGSPEPKGTAADMTDVVSGSYYEKAVAWAIENGITTGTTTSTFSPDATCTRAQAVTFLARALKAKAASAAEFSDVPTGSYFADAVAWAAANGVTEGIGGGLFGSNNDCTRGQIVTFLYRAYNK